MTHRDTPMVPYIMPKAAHPSDFDVETRPLPTLEECRADVAYWAHERDMTAPGSLAHVAAVQTLAAVEARLAAALAADGPQ